MSEPLHHIASLLRRIRSRQRLVWITALAGALCGLWLLLLMLTGSLEALFWLDSNTRQAVLIVGLGIGFLGIITVLALAGVILFSKALLHDRKLARLVWKLDPDVRDRILDALELVEASKQQGSDALRQLAVRQIDESVSSLEPARYTRTGELRLAARAGGIVLVASLVSFVFAGHAITGGLERVLHPKQAYIKPGTVILAMDMPARQEIIEGDTLLAAVRSHHNTPEQVRLFLDYGGGLVQEGIARADTSDPGRFLYSQPDVQRDVRIWAVADKASSDTVRVDVLPRPRLTRLEVTLRPPSYTGQDPLDLPEGVGDLTVLPGTQAHVSLEANRSLTSAKLNYTNGERTESHDLSLSDRTATGAFRVERAGEWWIELEAEDGVSGEEPLHWTVALQEDLPPEIDIRLPEDGYEIPETMQAPLALIIDDDYGVSKANLRFRVYNSLLSADSVSEEQYNTIGLRGHEDAPGRWVIQTIWGFADMALLPSEEIRFFIEAWDNDGWRGAKRSRSEERRLIFMSLEDLYRESNEEEEAITREMERMLEDAQRIREDMEQTLEEMRSNPEEMTWEQAQAMEQAVQSQEEMMQQLEQMREAIDQMQQKFEENRMVDPELMEKYQRLQELMEEVSSPELQQAMENLRSALEEMDGEQVREALEQMSQNQEAMMENLDRSLSILEQLKLERRMEELVKRSEDLAQRESELEQRLEEGEADAEREAMRQQQLEEDFEALMEEMEKVAEEMQESNPQVADSLRQLAEKLREEQLDQQLSETTQQLQQGQMKQAQKSAQKNQESLQQMTMQMQGFQQQMMQENKDQLKEQMDRIIQELLVISRRQEDLRSASALLGVASPRYRELAARQESMISALGRASESATELMKQTFFVGAKLMGELEVAHGQMNSALERYTARRATDVTGAQSNAMAAIHRSLLTINQAKQQMQSSGSGTGYQEMMDKLQQMAQQQQAINQSTQGMPMPVPGSQPGQDMLSQMAAKQRALSEAMRQLEQQSQSMEEMLGSLDGMGNAMEEVANDLRDRNVTDRTRRMQRRILQRLLDSQRSLQEREYSRERKSRSGEDTRRMSPAELQQHRENLLRERMLRALDADYAESWRPLIRNYFRALEKQQAQPEPDESSR